VRMSRDFEEKDWEKFVKENIQTLSMFNDAIRFSFKAGWLAGNKTAERAYKKQKAVVGGCE